MAKLILQKMHLNGNVSLFEVDIFFVFCASTGEKIAKCKCGSIFDTFASDGNLLKISRILFFENLRNWKNITENPTTRSIKMQKAGK